MLKVEILKTTFHSKSNRQQPIKQWSEKRLTQIGVAPLSRPRYVQQSRGGSTWHDSNLSATLPLRYTTPDTYNKYTHHTLYLNTPITHYIHHTLWLSGLVVSANDFLFINRLTASPSATALPAILSSRDRSIADYTEWAIKNRPPTCQLIMSSKSNVHLKWITHVEI